MLLAGLHCLFGIKISVLLLETFHPPGSIDKLLLAGIKRVAYAANIHFNAFGRRTGLKCIATGTVGCDKIVIGMNFFFHDITFRFTIFCFNRKAKTNFFQAAFRICGETISGVRTRTGDLGLMNPALYQLSYAAGFSQPLSIA